MATGQEYSSEITYIRRYAGDNCYSAEVAGKEPAECAIMCANSMYTFSLKKSPDGAWILNKIDFVGGKKSAGNEFDIDTMPELKVIGRDHYMSAVQIPLYKILEVGGDKVKILSGKHNENVCTISYEYHGPMHSMLGAPIQNTNVKLIGTVTLSIADNWSIIEQEEGFSLGASQATHKWTNRVRTNADYTRLIAREGSTAVSMAGKSAGKLRIVKTYSDDDVGVAEDHFRLSHYGLPEPEGIVWKKPIPLYVWLLSGAAGLGLIALICRWLLRRRSAKSVPVAPPPAA